MLGMSATVVAEEGGSGHYTPGRSATLIDTPPNHPGFTAQLLGTVFRGDASVSQTVPVAGLVTSGLTAHADVASIGGLYTFEQRILGAFLTVGAYAPFYDTTVKAEVVTQFGRTEQSDRVSGLGDMILVPAILAWIRGDMQYSAGLPIYAPTGIYDKDRIANTGYNYWTVDPTVSVQYFGSTNGFNASLFAGVTLNTQNEATDYQSGSMFHAEASVQQLFPVGAGFVGVGANAFWLEQITPDSGPGAILGDYKGRSLGIGPVVNYILPREDVTTLLELRWLPEIDSRNRISGNFFLLKGAFRF